VDGRGLGHARRVDNRLAGHQRQARRDASILPLIAMKAIFRAIRELAEALFELGRVLRIGRDARAHHGRLRIPQFEQHLQFLP
jgi:hypothetical protein